LISPSASKDDYFRARKVLEAAKEDPKKFAHLVERMDRTGRINGAFRQLKFAQESEKIRQDPKPLSQGPFRVGVIDPRGSSRKVTDYPDWA
jgi:hypothetical protein